MRVEEEKNRKIWETIIFRSGDSGEKKKEENEEKVRTHTIEPLHKN